MILVYEDYCTFVINLLLSVYLSEDVSNEDSNEILECQHNSVLIQNSCFCSPGFVGHRCEEGSNIRRMFVIQCIRSMLIKIKTTLNANFVFYFILLLVGID